MWLLPPAGMHERAIGVAERSATMSHGTVLIVEDEAPIQEMLFDALSVEGCNVLVSHDRVAVLVAHDRQPGVILLDLDMPGRAGVDVRQHLRTDTATAHIPIITLSTTAQGGAPQGLLTEDWLQKPFHLADLYGIVAKWMPPAGRAVKR
jgi:CheY-like chemotaxis protein